MKLLKILTLFAVTALTATGIASAATPTSPAGTTYTGKVQATSEGHVIIDNPIARIECSSALEGAVKSHGGLTSIPITSLSFTGCTNSWHVTVVAPGSLEVHAIPNSKNGTVTWSGATIVGTRFGVECRYATSSTDIGTLTGSTATGATATIDLSGKLPFHGGSVFCGEGLTSFTGNYSVSTPDYLDVDPPNPGATSPAGTTYMGKIDATSEGHTVIDNPIAKIECSSTLAGEVKPPSAGGPVSIPLTSLSFTGCTNSWHMTVVSPGSLEVHAIAGSKNGTVTWSGATIVGTRFGVECRYATSNTHIGTLTGSTTTSATATIDLSGKLPFHSGSSFCGEGLTSFTGSYSVLTPDYLDVDVPSPTPTSPAGTTYTGNLQATSEGHIVIHNPIEKIECSSAFDGEVKSHGPGESISVPLTSLFFNCTGSWTDSVQAAGTFEIHGIPGSKSGTVTSNGMTVKFVQGGVECVYATSGTHVGTLTGSNTTGATATIDLSAALLFHSGSSLCGEAATSLTGSYRIGTPDYLVVDS
jgi:hypothetical protein